MRDVVADAPPGPKPTVGPRRGRWSDVSAAAAAAAQAEEMAVVRAEQSEDERVWNFTIKTLGDRTGSLHVRRVDGRRIFEANAHIGRLIPDQTAADRLVDAFEDAMRAMSRKPKFPAEGD